MRRRPSKAASSLALAVGVLLGWSSIANAQWTGLANAFPSGHAEHCLLLTDGTVMCHEYNTNRWHRLKPDINGSYQNGTWDDPGFTVADMPNGTDANVPACAGGCTYQPLFFASAVLADGRVVVIGGEYINLSSVWANIGFLYDPVTNIWSSQIVVPASFKNSNGAGSGGIGDASSVILKDGTMLLATTAGTDIASFNPATLTFTALGPTSKDDSNDQENWTILPNGKVLTVDSRTVQRSEVYDPATNAWENAVDTQVNLADVGAGTKNSSEVGPVVQRPDGTAIAFSGTNSGLNAVYDTNTGTWSAAPSTANFPVSGSGHFAVADGPAALLPNGNVLVMASPVDSTNVFQTPSHFYEFDGTNLTAVTDAANAASFISYQGRFLVLPTGEVLLTVYNQCPCNGGIPAVETVALYSNGSGPQDAWRPVITVAPSTVIGGNTYSISGKLFNGFSEGASYGDDAQMSTNYPLVRITNHATGHVFYARTHDHSRMGVEAVGSNEIVTTQFDAPVGMESGPSDLVVVANGIRSKPVVVNGPDLTITKTHNPPLFTQGDAGDTFTITVGNDGQSATSGTVTVNDVLPPSLTATAMSGSGWSCNVGSVTCTRNDVLGTGSFYPAITLTVSVANDAPILVTNTATVSGGGQADTSNLTGNDTVTDDVNVRQHTTTKVDSATQDYHDVVTLRATVSPAGVSGTVSFLVNGVAAGAASYDSSTGVATLAYLINLAPPGPYTIEADFTSGDVLYLNSSGTNNLTVTREETTLSYTGDTVIANGGTATMSGVLLEDGLVAIAGRTVTFKLGTGVSAQTCNGVTNASGVATCAISPVAQPLGPGVVADTFAGDVYYLPSSASGTTIVFAFLTRGAFDVGDLSAPIGSGVTFWGAQWSADNGLSGGAALPEFKGFAGTLTAEPPNCGITWTTAPGNSPAPPGTIPTYMGVLVPTHVVKSGSTISGDVLSIVVVQTNGGYGPNPGHPGTGTVVAQFCHR